MNKFDIKILNSYVKGKGFCVEKHPNADLFIYGYSNNNSIKWDDYSLNIRGLILDGNGNLGVSPNFSPTDPTYQITLSFYQITKF